MFSEQVIIYISYFYPSGHERRVKSRFYTFAMTLLACHRSNFFVQNKNKERETRENAGWDNADAAIQDDRKAHSAKANLGRANFVEAEIAWADGGKEQAMNQANKFTPRTSIGELFSRGEINNRTLMAVRRALAELHGPRMTAQNPRLEELSFMPREMLLKQRNFGARSMRQLDRICQHVGVSIGAEAQGFTLYPHHQFQPAFPRD